MPFIATHNTGDYLARPYRNPANFLMSGQRASASRARRCLRCGGGARVILDSMFGIREGGGAQARHIRAFGIASCCSRHTVGGGGRGGTMWVGVLFNETVKASDCENVLRQRGRRPRSNGTPMQAPSRAYRSRAMRSSTTWPPTLRSTTERAHRVSAGRSPITTCERSGPNLPRSGGCSV